MVFGRPECRAELRSPLPGPIVPRWRRALGEGGALPGDVADALAERGIGGHLEVRDNKPQQAVQD
jgi:hypothetical protein